MTKAGIETMAKRFLTSISVVFCLHSFPALTLDNPDAPDLVADFAARSAAYEARIDEAAGKGSNVVGPLADYYRFLDEELNRAYEALSIKLDRKNRSDLINSQRKWIAFRDSEFKFISGNWTPDKFGDSFRLSSGNYRASLVKDRIQGLLNYLKNYR